VESLYATFLASISLIFRSFTSIQFTKVTEINKSGVKLLSVKVKLKQSRYRPGVAQRVQEVKFPRLHENGTGWW